MHLSTLNTMLYPTLLLPLLLMVQGAVLEPRSDTLDPRSDLLEPRSDVLEPLLVCAPGSCGSPCPVHYRCKTGNVCVGK